MTLLRDGGAARIELNRPDRLNAWDREFGSDLLAAIKGDGESLLGEKIGAEQALQWGLINRVVDDEALSEEVGALIDRLAAGPTRSYAGTKRQINNRVYAGIEEQLNLEAKIQQEQAATSDFMEGVAAFVERRPARFKGR